MNTRVLSLLLRPTSGQAAIVLLPVIAFALVTTLILTVVGGAQSFWSMRGDFAPLYQALAAIALVLLVVPLAGLGAAAARLSARRRDERLSTLRLLGVTPLGVGIATVVESVLISAIGATAGVVGYLALSPLMALIHFRGSALGLTSVILPWITVLILVSAILLIAAGSAALGLRRVIISPLGVRTRATVTGAHWLRAAIAVVALALAFGLMNVFPSLVGPTTIVLVLAGLFAIVLMILNVIGPWMLKVSASRQLRRAERPERLLAARTVLDSPKAAWRQVSGIAMSSFMAVFAGTGVSLMSMLDADGASAESLMLVTDMRTGLIITLVASFLMVAASVGVNQAATILDERELHRSLHHLGVPLTTVDAARRRAIMSPLMITAIGSAACAAALVFPLLGIAVIVAPLSLMTITTVIAVGIGLVWLSTRLTRPLLARSFRTVCAQSRSAVRPRWS